MKERKHIFILIVIMSLVALVTGGISISTLYRTSINESRNRLIVTAQSQARLIEAMARFDSTHNNNFPKGATAATLKQISDAHNSYRGFGETGEFTLSKRENDNIVFLLNHRHYDLDKPKPLPFNSPLAEPMRRALLGQSGSIIDLDYRGETVLAAYEPVKVLNLGIVAKIDLAEIRTPFINAALLCTLFAITVIALGIVLLLQVSNPILTSLAEKRLAIKESEQRYDLLIDSMSQGFGILDENGVFSLANKKLCSMLGYSLDEIIGTKPTDYMDETNTAVVNNQLTARKKGIELPYEVCWTARDGRQIPTIASPKAQFDNQRNFKGSFAVVTDISVQKKMEEELEKAKIIAEEANKAKSQFLTNMSHEIRTPMNSIIGMTDLVLRHELDPKTKKHLEIVKTSSKSLLLIINDILDLSKIDAGQLVLQEMDFSLHNILNHIEDIFTQTATKKGIRLSSQRPNEVPSNLIGDPLRLEQILINLVSNAVKFTDSGEIVIAMECRKLSSDKATIEFSITDTGIGIDPEILPSLFQPFAQADSTITRTYGGTGLGLTISKRLVEMMGGTIWSESSPGSGTIFYFAIPFALQQFKQIDPAPELQGKRVLVVDDDPLVLEMTQAWLENSGMEVTAIEAPEQALSILKAEKDAKKPFELIIIDFMMPGQDGLVTAKQISSDPDFTEIPMIMITAYGKDYSEEAAQKSNIRACLYKPVQLKLFQETILNILSSDSSPSKKEEAKSASPSYFDIPDLQGAHILLAEDNAFNQVLAEELLTDAGITVTIANNGQEALAMADQDFNAILMDIQMPEMDGLTATRLIRQNQQLAKLPIIAMTAHAMADHREQCLQAGMNDFIKKPIELDKLFPVLLKWIKPVKHSIRNQTASGSLPENLAAREMCGVELPDNLPGIDIKSCLAKLSGNKRLLGKLVQQFYQSNRAIAKEVKQAFESDDYETARRLIHSLKGTAGILSAVKLQSLATELNSAVKSSDRNGVADCYLPFEYAFDELLGSLLILDNTFKAAQSKLASQELSVASPVEQEMMLKKLEVLLGNNDLEGPEYLDAIRESFTGSTHHPEIEKMAVFLERFNFKEAREILQKILN